MNQPPECPSCGLPLKETEDKPAPNLVIVRLDCPRCELHAIGENTGQALRRLAMLQVRTVKLSEAQRKCLNDVAKHDNAFYSCRGRSEHGGRWQVIASLIKRHLLQRNPPRAPKEYTVTTAGDDARLQ